MRGVSLDADEATHAVQRHYSFANRSICRFVDHSHVEFVCDLVFEIDAHAGPLTGEMFADPTWYVPSIGSAVAIGRRILDYLQITLGVDSRFITTSVTRMGARVTVDWRAFGPRSLAQVLAVVRYVETRAVPLNVLARLADRLRRAQTIQVRRLLREASKMRSEVLEEPYQEIDPPVVQATIEVDGGIYRVSERSSRDLETSSRFLGPLCRPPGALHSRSSQQAMHCRVTPVPHDQFHPRYARWLSRVSRSRGPDLRRFLEPDLFGMPWPETRRPDADRLVDGLRPCAALCDLFDRWKQLELPEAYRAEVTAQERRSRPIRIPAEVTAEMTPEAIHRIVDGLAPTKTKRRGQKISMTCPYCHSPEASAVVYVDTGAFSCPRSKCSAGSRGIAQVALDFGLGKLVPWKRASSQMIQRRKLAEMIRSTPAWSDVATVDRATHEVVEDSRAWLSERLDEVLRRDDWHVVIVRGPTGVGKTTTTLEACKRHGVVLRGAFPRDESRLALVDAYEPDMPTRLIDGRRESNCRQHELISTIQSRGLPPRLVCNRECPHRRGCPYLAQFEDLDGVSLGLNHAHLPLLDLARFDNGSEVVLIDENPLGAAVETIDLDGREIDLLRVGRHLTEEPFVDPIDGSVTVYLDGTLERAGATPAIERLIAWLEHALTREAMARLPQAGDLVADLRLARHWMVDERLPEILAEIGEDDLELHDALVMDVAEAYLRDSSRPKPPRTVLRSLVEALKELNWIYQTGTPRPSRLFVMRDATAWAIRMTQRRNLQHGRTIILSSTMTATQFLLAYGQVVGVHVIEPELAHREKRILVADRQLGTTKLLGSKLEERKIREELFETAVALIEQEKQRTGLPVALLGRAEVLNHLLKFVSGRALPDDLRMPFRVDRAERMARLRTITEPLGFLCGYAGGVSGSNEFHVGGRFVRSAIVLGGTLPNLVDVEAQWRGALSWFPFTERVDPGDLAMDIPIDRAVDWTVVPRPVAIDGTAVGEHGHETISVAGNVFGYADPIANELLRHAYEDELAQMVGRMRGCIPDPAGVEARAYVLAHVAIAGWPVDELLDFDGLRERVGLPRLQEGAGRPQKGREALAGRVRRDGRPAAIAWLVGGLLRSGHRSDHRRSRAVDVAIEAGRLLEAAGQRPLSQVELLEAAEAARALLDSM